MACLLLCTLHDVHTNPNRTKIMFRFLRNFCRAVWQLPHNVGLVLEEGDFWPTSKRSLQLCPIGLIQQMKVLSGGHIFSQGHELPIIEGCTPS